MGSGRGNSVERAAKTAFFMVIMVASFLVSSAPLLVSLVDVIAPCILLSTFACCSSCFGLKRDWAAYSFRTSMLDIPLLSLLRSFAILCAYSICGISTLTYGPYVGTTAVCGMISAIVLMVKACVLADNDLRLTVPTDFAGLQGEHAWGRLLLFFCSMVLALGHIIVAYKVRCRARRKLHLYKLDQEAIAALNPLLYARVKERYHMHPAGNRWEDDSAEEGFKNFELSGKA